MSTRPNDTGLFEPSDEAAFLMAIGMAEARGFDWRQIKPEDRGDWARRVLAWEAEKDQAA